MKELCGSKRDGLGLYIPTTSSSSSHPLEAPNRLNLVNSTMTTPTSMEENLARMGLEKLVETVVIAEQMDNTSCPEPAAPNAHRTSNPSRKSLSGTSLDD